jgi:pre-mRNA branch site protein p14
MLTPCSQIRQGIANNTKGTAFVVYEDVMDAKQACDKLNGFNFQNRYLVGTSILPNLADITDTNISSALSPTRQDGQVKTGPRGAQGEFRAA